MLKSFTGWLVRFYKFICTALVCNCELCTLRRAKAQENESYSARYTVFRNGQPGHKGDDYHPNDGYYVVDWKCDSCGVVHSYSSYGNKPATCTCGGSSFTGNTINKDDNRLLGIMKAAWDSPKMSQPMVWFGIF